MFDKDLTDYCNGRKFILSLLSEEECINIIQASGINLEFNRMKVKKVNVAGKTELRLGERYTMYLTSVSEFNKALRVNNQTALSGKATTANSIEFSDKYFTLKNENGKRLSVITPKGVILYALCTHGNQYVQVLKEKTYESLYRIKQSMVEDKLSHVFKRVV